MAGSHSRRSNGPILPISNNTRHSGEYRSDRRSRRYDSRDEQTTGGKVRGHLVAMSGEFAGTFLFLFFAFGGVQVANSLPVATGSETILFISLAFGFSLLVNVWVFYRISGGLFNPAVTLGMCLTGHLPVIRGLVLFPAQILAGICAPAVVDALLPGTLNVNTVLQNGISVVQGLFLEMFLTSLLVITVLMLAGEKHKSTFLAPVGIGLALFVAELMGVFYTGGSLNPARSFGPDVVTRSFPSYHWIYWLGPFLGAFIAAGYYWFAKAMRYEDANPGQDAIHPVEQDQAKRESSTTTAQ